MRTFVMFTLALAGAAILSDDASAIGKRNRGASSGCGGCGAPAVTTSSCGGCGSSYGGYGSGYGYPGAHQYPGRIGYATGVGGQAATVQGTDGQFYSLGADGSYYAAGSIPTLGGFAGQPYTSSYTPSMMYPGYGTYQNVSPAGYPGTPGYVYPAGGSPLTMPGATIPGSMPLRR